MKRGLIEWNRTELPTSVFDARLSRARTALAEGDLPALLVYTDVWRSNQARFLTNFMPYWNRSLVVIPLDSSPVLLCALSPRVYPWIKSVTIFEDIRPASKLMQTLDQLCAERHWRKLGVLDLPMLPIEIHSRLGAIEAVDVPSKEICEPDAAELSMRRRAAILARQILEEQLPHGANALDHHFVGRLEREFRSAGAEDLVIRLSPSGAVPRPANGSKLGASYSVAVSLEYCGHWVKITRASGNTQALRSRFNAALESGEGLIENLSGPLPFEAGPGAIFALHVEHQGLYFGDTCAGTSAL
ncbi:MAG TPA: hypothetical protein VGG72_15915 [Bryobacteraceae bacterium]|jgi:hypothetical protein